MKPVGSRSSFERAARRAFDSFGSRYAVWFIIVGATLLGTSSLRGQRALDDWVIAVVARGEGAGLGLSERAWDSFTFTTGDHVRNMSMMNRGVLLPWWTDPGLKLAFFRPLAALTHLLDEWSWPTQPLLHHAHSLLWFSLLLGAVGVVYRRLSGDVRLANVALAFYAYDDAHGATLSWLANRNALISGVFGCACIAVHDLWRRGGRRLHGVCALLCFVLSCLASELAVGALAYLLAYAAFLDPAPPRERVRSLLGYVGATLIWRTGWSLAGYGARGSGTYVDPLTDPARFFVEAPGKWLSLLQGQLGVIPADFAFLGPAEQQTLWTITALVTLTFAAVFLRPCVTDARGRFWLCGALLSLLPMAASFPSDRLLLFVGLGCMPLFARAFCLAATRLTDVARLRASTLAVYGLAALFFAIHGILAPLLLPLRAGQMGRMARAEDAALRELRALAGTSNELLILNAPSVVLTSYAQVQLKAQGEAPFARPYVLSATDSQISVSRDGEREFTLRAERGFLHSPLERHYRGVPASLAEQGRVELAGLSAEVGELLPDGRPRAVHFTVARELSDYACACWTNGHFRRCQVPDRGRVLRLPAEDLGSILFSQESAS